MASEDRVRPFLTDAELILGLARHLGIYAVGRPHAELSNLEFAGYVYEMAWRLRGSGLSTIKRVEAIGLEAGIAPRQLLKEVLPALETLGWVEVGRDADGVISTIDERIPPPADLLRLSDSVVTISTPRQTERAALIVLRETSRLPLTLDAAMELASASTSEEAARSALDTLSAVQLVRKVKTDDGREVVFNPFIWQGDTELSRAALRAEDSRARKEVGALIEEVAAQPGLPQAHVTSTSREWVDFAVSQGLVQRTVVETSRKDEQASLFTPHFGRDPFGTTSGDPSGHVRQLVGSMIYAATFATHKLHTPRRFVQSLVNYGEAGDASDIGTDYTMLETAGIIKVEPSYRYKKMVLLQPDVAEEALTYLEGGTGAGSPDDVSGITDQRSYGHLERERAKVAAQGRHIFGGSSSPHLGVARGGGQEDFRWELRWTRRARRVRDPADSQTIRQAGKRRCQWRRPQLHGRPRSLGEVDARTSRGDGKLASASRPRMRGASSNGGSAESNSQTELWLGCACLFAASALSPAGTFLPT